MKALQYRLYLTKKQAQHLDWILICCCELYNALLQEQREMYTSTGKGINYNAQANQLLEVKEMREEYKNIYSQALQDTLRRVNKAFQTFFRRVTTGEKAGYPRFQGIQYDNSFSYPQAGFSVTGGQPFLSKIGHGDGTCGRAKRIWWGAS